MKKIFSTLMALAMAAVTFTACEDVPEPYDIPGTGNNEVGGNEIEGATGNGTKDAPFNCAAVLNYINGLEAGVNSDDYVYITGKVVSVKEEFTTQYGNGTFYISDDGTTANQFYVYRAKYLGNKKFTASDTQIKVGDEVTVCGKVVNYAGNTPETVQGECFLYILNGENRGGEPTASTGGGSSTTDYANAKGTGTKEDPYNVEGVLKFTTALGKDEQSTHEVFFKGKISSISEEFGTTYGNASFNVSDDGTTSKEFKVFRTLYVGNRKFVEGDTQIKVGDEVIIRGYVTNYYGNTPETVTNKSYIYGLNGQVTDAGEAGGTGGSTGGGTEGGSTGGGSDTPAGGNVAGTVEGNTITVNPADFGFTETTDLTTITLTLTDGTKLNFTGGGNTNGPKYYTTAGGAIRMYPKNTMTVKAEKKISKVELTCDVYQGNTYNASGDISATSGTVATADTQLSITGIGASAVTLTDVSTTTGAPSQLRIKKLVITYE